jgi:hypothetical protein
MLYMRLGKADWSILSSPSGTLSPQDRGAGVGSERSLSSCRAAVTHMEGWDGEQVWVPLLLVNTDTRIRMLHGTVRDRRSPCSALSSWLTGMVERKKFFFAQN